MRLAHLLDEQAEEEPLVDLVVFDEAHYMRNPESSVHRLGEMLQKVSQQRVLLSALPVNLCNDDVSSSAAMRPGTFPISIEFSGTVARESAIGFG